ncbi:response regulator receiver and ANTAR domain protein [Clostridium collagenovorans DSM 3089]|uniref:Stage 0 sporulation protein A homolog n=1 Tax=Clostridium collagenovorans DSM 3089 TaxID=1121306 RepID=A0A1M5TBW3_9CLOT|nr:response regulator [Clostridium collagenovorans]SHH48176.1 response regulator receiver and ANTAR domain protein [Clostridium collagenovorans DSM 3089]
MVKRIVIADDEPITRMDIKEMLQEEGYDVVAEAGDGFDAIEACRKSLPHLVIMDIKMPLLDGLNAAKKITQENLADGVVLLTAYSDKDFIERAKEAGVLGYLVKPLDHKALIPTIEIALNKANEIKRIKKDFKSTKEKLEARKVIEKAKGILMNQKSITEEEAYITLRNLSMDKRVTMKEIAEIIVMSST